MSTHNIHFHDKIEKKILELSEEFPRISKPSSN